MQLYSVEQKRSQALEAHSAAFTTLNHAGKQTQAIVFTTKTYANGVMNSKIHCIALGGGAAHKKNAELFFPTEFTDDFPVSLHIRWVSTAAEVAFMCQRCWIRMFLQQYTLAVLCYTFVRCTIA